MKQQATSTTLRHTRLVPTKSSVAAHQNLIRQLNAFASQPQQHGLQAHLHNASKLPKSCVQSDKSKIVSIKSDNYNSIKLNNHRQVYHLSSHHQFASLTTPTKQLIPIAEPISPAQSNLVPIMRTVLVIIVLYLTVKLRQQNKLQTNRSSSSSSKRNSNKAASDKHALGARQNSAALADCHACTCSRRNSRQENPDVISQLIAGSTAASIVADPSHQSASSILHTAAHQAALVKQNKTQAAVVESKIMQLQQEHRQKLFQMEEQQRDLDLQLQCRNTECSSEARKSLKMPPGPMGLPFVGYLPFIGPEIHLTLTSLSEKYGPIYQIYLGGIRVLVLNDATLIRQAFKQQVFSGRPDTQLTRLLQGYGIVNSGGALWKEQRAFLHTTLRKLGAKSLMGGANGLEAKIQTQVREFVTNLEDFVDTDKSHAFQVRPILARAVSSVVGSIVMNLTYRKFEEKARFDRLIELMHEGFRLFMIAMPLDFIPIFRFLPGVSYAYKKMKKNRDETSAFFMSIADEHRKYLSETFNLQKNNSPDNERALHPKFINQSKLQNMPTNSHLAHTFDKKHLAASSLKHATAISKSLLHTTTSNLVKLVKGAKQRLSPHCVNVTSSWLSLLSQATDSSYTCSTPIQQTADQVKLDKNQKAAAQQLKLEELNKITPRDLVDAYILQQAKHQNDGKENYFSDKQLIQIMSDIFSAGLETVTSTIEWSILFLILNPECQEQIQDEIERVIGRERTPKLEDLSNMPYTEATIYEVLRRSNVVALGNTHATLADASLAGYKVPKGTHVLPNLYSINMDPKLWTDPNKFDPNRFISNDKAIKPDHFIPFSVGRRMCLGDVLAKMEVYLFLVGLLQKYDLCVADEDKLCPPKVKGTIGVSNAPAAFKVALKHRATKPLSSSLPKTTQLLLPTALKQPITIATATSIQLPTFSTFTKQTKSSSASLHQNGYLNQIASVAESYPTTATATTTPSSQLPLAPLSSQL